MGAKKSIAGALLLLSDHNDFVSLFCSLTIKSISRFAESKNWVKADDVLAFVCIVAIIEKSKEA